MDSNAWLSLRFEHIEPLTADSRVELVADRLVPGRLGVRKSTGRPDEAAALAREAGRLLELSHPGLRRLWAMGHGGDDQTTLILEHVDGAGLEAHLRTDPDDATRIAVELLRILTYLHGRDRVHGDLKPDNIIVTARERAPRLIDLGLSARAGTTPRGGTGALLPPEYERGAPLSAAGDLYSFGKTLVQAAGTADADWPRPLRELVDACCERSPDARPASAALALARLGRYPLAADRLGTLTPLATDAVDSSGTDALDSFDGTCLVLRGGPGSGKSRYAAALARRAWKLGRPVADATFGAAREPLLALRELLLPHVVDDGRTLPELIAETLARAAREEIVVILDDADLMPEGMGPALEQGVRALTALGRGLLVLVGADREQAERLAAAGARRLDLPRLSEEPVRKAFSEAGVRLDDALVETTLRGSRGHAGAVARAVMALLDEPELGPEELEERLDGWTRRPEAEELPHETVEQAISGAALDLAACAGRRAARRLLRAVPDLADHPREQVDAALLLARSHALQGDIAAAAGLIGDLGDAAPAAARLERVLHLERLGRLDEALSEASDLYRKDSTEEVSPRLAARAAVVAGMAALATGDVSLAEEHIDGGLGLECDDGTRTRLLLVRSDAALRKGNSEEALALASRAGDLLGEVADSRLRALVHSRQASALALGGKPLLARDQHRAALEAAEAAGDVVGLPPYIVNVATAEHAVGELGSAIVRYEEAAHLAERTGRRAMSAAALTNLAGLYVSVGALEEAERALSDAAEAARASGSAVLEHQTLLIRAELEGKQAPERGRSLAGEARQRFRECGAARQSLEATLLEAELSSTTDERRAARLFCDRHLPDLDDSGLGVRARLLRARLALADEELDEARRAAEAALALATAENDLDLIAQSEILLTSVHRLLGTGGEEAHAGRARETYASLAARLPSGLRARFLAAPERATASEPAPRAQRPQAEIEGLGAGGRRIVTLVTRVLLEQDEGTLLEAAVDEAVAATRAERAFLLRRRLDGASRNVVIVARNLDRESLRQARRTSFSRSVADQVISTEQLIVTAMAPEDPRLQGKRSILDLGVRSILCVPVRSPQGVIGALYLDHRFHEGRFGEAELELIQAIADVIGLALENARLHREAGKRTEQLERANEAVSRENARRALEIERLAERLARSGETEPEQEGGIVGRDRALRSAINIARRVAPSDLPVLITGESGTGKELLARYVHDQSLRSGGPFLAINCGSIPEPLLESELFGHVRGAFTGADRDHPGLFRSARGGTVLLDEIGEMPLGMQTRILRALQEREVVPVGSTDPIGLDVRVIAATNRNLEEEVVAGRFRKDLYFRLVGAVLGLPPLRERVGDIPILARQELSKIAEEPGMRKLTLSREALVAMVSHSWPGNVRELFNALRRAVLVAEGDEIGPDDLGTATVGMPRKAALRKYDEQLVTAALQAAGGNRTVAARALGVSRMTVHRWIKRYGLRL